MRAIKPYAYAVGYHLYIQKSRVRIYVTSGIKNIIPCTRASVPMRIPISFLSGISALAIQSQRTRAKIGRNKRNQRIVIACSPLSFTHHAEKI